MKTAQGRWIAFWAVLAVIYLLLLGLDLIRRDNDPFAYVGMGFGLFACALSIYSQARKKPGRS